MSHVAWSNNVQFVNITFVVNLLLLNICYVFNDIYAFVKSFLSGGVICSRMHEFYFILFIIQKRPSSFVLEVVKRIFSQHNTRNSCFF